MNSVSQSAAPHAQPIRGTIERACRVIAPSWPLDRQIAVNPYWRLIDRSFEAVADDLRRLHGSRFALAPEAYLDAWHAGKIPPSAIARALAECDSRLAPDDAVQALRAGASSAEGLALPSDLVDRASAPAAGPRWSEVITQQVSQYCASYFDEHQADWHRAKAQGLYLGWRAVLLVDHAVEPLKRAPEIHIRAGELPDEPEAAITWALARIGVPTEQSEDFLKACLLRINGWASWCAYLGWEAGLVGGTDPHLQELLAIRTCWEALLVEAPHRTTRHEATWNTVTTHEDGTSETVESVDRIWQRADEIAYQDQLVALLDRAPAAERTGSSDTRSSAQLVFCIDVRSERFRRALETVHPTVETRGFAGFFGLPIQYRPIGTPMCRPQLPGLLSPALDVSDSAGAPEQDRKIARRRARALEARGALQPFQRLPSGAFSLVETIGIGYAAALLGRHFGGASDRFETLGLSAADASALRPRLVITGSEATRRKSELAASVLRAMGLTTGFARLLVLVGHGSQSANNPHAAGLDCGACGGQTGEVNARALAALLNEEPIRDALRDQGIDLPPTTFVLAALHNTTTDDVEIFDAALVPASHRREFEQLSEGLAAAGRATRAERAPDLGLGSLAARPDALLKQLRRRARDWAETRPEWGLANNASFIVAPRARTRGLNLEGRSFLHDYHAEQDPDGRLLELIMTAPMVVTNWINLQYFASTVDPDHNGSGNKVLHNVACGRIGVFEGNTGDLRIGLARQSLHDGERWMHAPLRLSVFIDAPRERIDAVLRKHDTVRQLVANRWLYLFRFSGQGVEWHRDGQWQRWSPEPPAL